MGEIDNAANSLNAFNTVVTQTASSVENLESKVSLLVRAFQIDKVRVMDIQFGSLQRSLSATGREVDQVRASIERLTKATEFYSKQEITKMVIGLKETSSSLTILNRDLELLSKKFVSAYSRDADRYLDKLKEITNQSPLLSERLRQNAQDLDTLTEAYLRGGREGLSAYITGSNQALKATKDTGEGIDATLRKLEKRFADGKVIIGEYASEYSNLIGGLGLLGGAATFGIKAVAGFKGLQFIGALPGGAPGGLGKIAGALGSSTGTMNVTAQVVNIAGGMGGGVDPLGGLTGSPGNLSNPGVGGVRPGLKYTDLSPTARFMSSRLGRVGVGLAGAGLLAGSEYLQQDGQSGVLGGMGVIAGAAGGAATGFSIAGPLGAAAGLLISSIYQVGKSISEVWNQRKKAIESAEKSATFQRDRASRIGMQGFGDSAEEDILRKITGVDRSTLGGVIQESQIRTEATGAKLAGREKLYEVMQQLRSGGGPFTRKDQKDLEALQKEIVELRVEAFKEASRSIDITATGMAAAQSNIGFQLQAAPGMSSAVTREALGLSKTQLGNITAGRRVLGNQMNDEAIKGRAQLESQENNEIQNRIKLLTTEQDKRMVQFDIQKKGVDLSTRTAGSLEEQFELRNKSVEISKDEFKTQKDKLDTLKEDLAGKKAELAAATDIYDRRQKEKEVAALTFAVDKQALTVAESKNQVLDQIAANRAKELDYLKAQHATQATINQLLDSSIGAKQKDFVRENTQLWKQLQAAIESGNKEQERFTMEQMKALDFRRKYFNLVEKPHAERQQNIDIKEQTAGLFGTTGVEKNIDIINDKLQDAVKVREAALELARKEGQELDPIRQKELDFNVKKLEIQKDLLEHGELGLRQVQRRTEIHNTELQILQTMKAPIGLIANKSKELLADAQDTFRSEKEKLATLRAQSDDQEVIHAQEQKVRQAQLAIIQQVDFQRRTFAEQFTEQSLNLPSGSYLNPNMTSQYSLLGPSFRTGASSRAGVDKGTYQSQVAEMFGMGADERTSAEQLFAKVLNEGLTINGQLTVNQDGTAQVDALGQAAEAAMK